MYTACCSVGKVTSATAHVIWRSGRLHMAYHCYAIHGGLSNMGRPIFVPVACQRSHEQSFPLIKKQDQSRGYRYSNRICTHYTVYDPWPRYLRKQSTHCCLPICRRSDSFCDGTPKIMLRLKKKNPGSPIFLPRETGTPDDL